MNFTLPPVDILIQDKEEEHQHNQLLPNYEYVIIDRKTYIKNLSNYKINPHIIIVFISVRPDLIIILNSNTIRSAPQYDAVYRSDKRHHDEIYNPICIIDDICKYEFMYSQTDLKYILLEYLERINIKCFVSNIKIADMNTGNHICTVDDLVDRHNNDCPKIKKCIIIIKPIVCCKHQLQLSDTQKTIHIPNVKTHQLPSIIE